MDLFSELGNILKPIEVNSGLTCKNCKHNKAWECNSKVFHYCTLLKSNRTANGRLKIKCKDKACTFYEI